jgi:hypothetical protein
LPERLFALAAANDEQVILEHGQPATAPALTYQALLVEQYQ